jgi:hypothetical protein
VGPKPALRHTHGVAKVPAFSVQPRLAAGLVLIAAGIFWAVARGLHFYGLSPAELAYDLDQPPLLLMLVGGWLLYRSRAR